MKTYSQLVTIFILSAGLIACGGSSGSGGSSRASQLEGHHEVNQGDLDYGFEQSQYYRVLNNTSDDRVAYKTFVNCVANQNRDLGDHHNLPNSADPDAPIHFGGFREIRIDQSCCEQAGLIWHLDTESYNFTSDESSDLDTLTVDAVTSSLREKQCDRNEETA